MLYIIVGPTCSKKTKAAIALSNFLHAPIINGDAFQIYQDMNIGTAKISKEDPYYSKHYLLDIVSPEVTFSVKDYQTAFRKTVDNLSKEYKDIVVCGGTGLYIKAAIYDYVFPDETDNDTSKLENKSDEELWEMLLKLDEKATLNLHPHNRKRVIRAIMIATNQQENKSTLIEKQEHKMIYNDVRILFINPPREKLYDEINKRVDDMIEEGLINEVKELQQKYNLSLTARQAIGYKEIIDYLNNEIDLLSAVELIKKRTRNYAKRQVTFFSHQFETKKYNSSEELIADICK